MENFSPIQVVAKARQFQQDRVRNGMDSSKEFFDGRDGEFATHKRRVYEQLQAVRARLVNSSAGSVGFVKVSMQEEALAKSHRPVKRLFSANVSPVAGSSGTGELIFQVSPSSISHALACVQRAEETLKYKPDPKNPEKVLPSPSKERSEVGSVEFITLWDAPDRRSFSASQAVHWMSMKGVPKAYRVDLFDAFSLPVPLGQSELDQRVVDGLCAELRQVLKCGFIGAFYRPDKDSMQRLYIWPLQHWETRSFIDAEHLEDVVDALHEPSLNVQHHQQLLEILGRHTAVRQISLLPALRSGSTGTTTPQATLPPLYLQAKPEVGAQYPTVGIIDGGTGPVHAAWTTHASQVVPEHHASYDHGGEIAGLLIGGQALNGPLVSPEPDGCHIVDLAMVPHQSLYTENYKSELSFTWTIEQEVKDAKAAVGARIFCFSHNFEMPSGHLAAKYSELSAGLDRISREQDVIFVVSAGNTRAGKGRKEWQLNPMAVLSDLASVNDDEITAPADSLFSVSVGALNPPSLEPFVPSAPARYSRRGLSRKHFVKPDVAHFGGGCNTTASVTGLWSTDIKGHRCHVDGTSYSGPLAAKTLARLDMLTQGQLSREALIALLIHGARQPDCLSGYDKLVARQLVGFGLPVASDDFLAGSPSQATVLFFDRMQNKQDLFFDFDWPQSLVVNGKCRGEAVLTLVYSPPLEDAYGDELVRINLDAVLQQRDKKSVWKKKCKDSFATKPNTVASAKEKHLIEEGLKWGTVKQVRFQSKDGVGTSSQWRIWVKYLMRATEVFPEEGIPFAALITILDPNTHEPVYQDMKIGLTARSIETNDIRASVRPEVRPQGSGQ